MVTAIGRPNATGLPSTSGWVSAGRPMSRFSAHQVPLPGEPRTVTVWIELTTQDPETHYGEKRSSRLHRALDRDRAARPAPLSRAMTSCSRIGAAFGRHFGFKALGIHHERLLPGRRTSYPHAESAEEDSST